MDAAAAIQQETTEVSEFQSIGDDTTLAAAKTKAKAACLSHSCPSIYGTYVVIELKENNLP